MDFWKGWGMFKSLLSFNGQDDPTIFLPAGWKAEQLNATCDIFGGGRLGLTKEKDYRSSGVLAFSAAGPDGFVEKAEISNKSGVILSAIGANCGRCFYAQGDWTTLANVQVIVPKSEINPRYLYYFVNRDGYWDKSGSAQPFIKPSSIRSSWIGFPPKPEQSKIAEVLSKVDQAIEQTESLIAKQKRIKTGLMQDILTRGIDEHGNLRSEETHEFKDSPLGRIPVEWEVDKLENVSDFITSGSRGWARYYSEEGAIFIRIGNLTREHIHMRFDDVICVNPPLTSEGKRTEVNAGDLLISITADLGIIAVIPIEFPEAYVNQHIALVRINKSKIVPCFAGWFLAGYRGQSQFDKLNESGAKAGLNLPTIKNLLVPMLDISEQEKIVKTLEANIYVLMEHQSQLSKLRSLKTALMQDLLTGKKQVTPLLENMEVCS
jgi:type I restriction enzyme S subunit